MKTRAGWYVVAILAAANFLNYAQRNVVFAAYDDLRAQFHPSDTALGLLTTAYMGAHALGTLPAGWLGDRVDRRKLLAGALFLWSLGALGAAAAPGIITLGLARAVTGIATAAVVPVATTIIAEVFPSDRKASILAIFNLGLFLGAATGVMLGANPGHPGGVLILGAVGFLVAVPVYRLDVPPLSRGEHTNPGFTELLRRFRALLRIRTLRWVMVSTTIMAFAAGGYAAWLLDFLVTGKGMSKQGALALFGVCLVAGLAGVILGGRIGDRLRRTRAHGRPLTIAIGMSSTVPCALLCIYAPVGPLLVIGAIATMFFVSWYHGPMAASVDDLAPDGRAATTQSLVIFSMHLFGTAPASFVVGRIKDAYGFTAAMLVPTGAIALAALTMTRAFPSFGADVTAARGSAMTIGDA